jgi:hypothetical protein
MLKDEVRKVAFSLIILHVISLLAILAQKVQFTVGLD